MHSELNRGVSGGPKGRGGGYEMGVPSRWWGFGAPPPLENFEKMVQNGAIWSINKAFKIHWNLVVSLEKLH